jgi:hypothetical protein
MGVIAGTTQAPVGPGKPCTIVRRASRSREHHNLAGASHGCANIHQPGLSKVIASVHP